MSRYLIKTFLLIALSTAIAFQSCKKVKEQDDQLYSRHLQRQVKITIINTPVPDDKSQLNLVIFNDGQLFDDLHMKEIVKELYSNKEILPVVIVGIHADANRLQEYGIANDKANASNPGGKADHYASFINNELYPYAKKNAGVRKFNTVTIAGFGAGALSALDFAWEHADKVSKVGMFSGAFSRKSNNADTASAGEMFDKMKASRKRPKTEFWFYAGFDNGTTGMKNDDASQIGKYTDTLVKLLSDKNFISTGDIVYKKDKSNTVSGWQSALPDFFKWAVGK